MESFKLLEYINNNEILYDYRKKINPNDFQNHSSDKKIYNYNLKYKLSEKLKFDKILEIGTDYGYTAFAFFEGNPNSKYTIIEDLNFRNEKSREWIKETIDNNIEFITKNIEKLEEFPGDFYDLVCIHNQKDGDKLYHVLELALEKSKWILVDDIYALKETMLSITYFTEKYNNFIDYSLIIPKYTGGVLIKIKENFSVHKKKNYTELMSDYSTDYYLQDCGGYDIFLKTKGKLIDERLQNILEIIDPKPGEKILDIGSGRGELSYNLFTKGANVIGIDYSKEATEISLNNYKNYIGENLKYINGDVLKLEEIEKFDKIIMADVVEHIEPDSLRKLYFKISKILKKNGKFIIHTAPNKLFYEIKYEEIRRVTKNMGNYIPKNPRTFYEELMHINEQTPIGLKEELSKYFKTVIVWTGDTIIGDYNIKEESIVEDINIFAICGDDLDVISEKQLIKYEQLKNDDLDIELSLKESNLKIIEIYDTDSKIKIKVKNNSNQKLISRYPYPVYLSYHIKKINGERVIFDGVRSVIFPSINSKEEGEVELIIKNDLKAGEYILEVTLVQENQFWFEEFNENIILEIPIRVK